MLVITRRKNEGFYVGDAYIRVLPSSTYDQIRLGIDAPKDINIVREELLRDKNDGLNKVNAR